MRLINTITLLMVGLSLSAWSLEPIAAPSTNLSFPREVAYEYKGEPHTLRATGTATRSKFFVNVYSVAHYMRHPIEGKKNIVFDEILRDNQVKQLTLKWVRDVDFKRIREGFDGSLDKVLKQQPVNIEEEKEQFLSYFNQPIQSGDEHIFRWLPGGVIEVEINGKLKGKIKSPEFARTMWSIWFGPKSVVSRNRLVSLLRGN